MWKLFLLLLVLFEGIADIFSKEWSLNGHWRWWVCAISAYIIANIFWLVALRKGAGLARGATLFFLASTIIAVLIGIIWYQETLTQKEMFGIVLGTISLILIIS